ncbi:Hpt domain-containing protein [Maribacter sp. R86514]|uniref:Hpt domain-containing protein n=1 Tax=Maribacter sp. R86514 TaxID=3093854 RepID=UPI0037CC7029
MIDQPNLKYVDELAGDDAAFRGQFIDIIKSEFPVEKQEYFEFVESSKDREAAEMVHKLKHKFNILGMENAYRLAVAYEMELLDGKRDIKSKFDEVLEIIEQYIKTI